MLFLILYLRHHQGFKIQISLSQLKGQRCVEMWKHNSKPSFIVEKHRRMRLFREGKRSRFLIFMKNVRRGMFGKSLGMNTLLKVSLK